MQKPEEGPYHWQDKDHQFYYKNIFWQKVSTLLPSDLWTIKSHAYKFSKNSIGLSLVEQSRFSL